MAKAKRLPRIVDRALFDVIDVKAIKHLEKEGEPRRNLIEHVENQLGALVEAVDVGRYLMGRYPYDQALMDNVEEIIQWAIGEVDPEAFVRRALRL